MGIGAIRSGELSIGQGILIIAIGVGLAAIGWWISDRKQKKKIEKARMEQFKKSQEAASQNSENISYSTSGASQNSGNTSYSTSSASQNSGNTSYSTSNASQKAEYTSGSASQNTENTANSSSKGAGSGTRDNSQNKSDAAPGSVFSDERSNVYREESASGSASCTMEDESKDQIRFCSKCGASLVSGALFCSACGVKIRPPKTGGQKDASLKPDQSKQLLEVIFQKSGEYREKGDYQKELDTLKTGLIVDEKNSVLLNDIGNAYQHLGDYHSALEYYFRSAKEDPNALSIGTNIATAYYSMGEYDQAQKYYEGEIGKLEMINSPESEKILCTVYANYALCVGKSGDFNKAREYLVKAEKAGNKDCDEIWSQLLRG